jgi:hypothetical protein
MSGILGITPASPRYKSDPGKSAASAVKKHVAVFGTQTATATAPDSRGYFSFGATPGGQVEDHIAIKNFSTFALQLLIHGTDGVNTPQGGFALLPPNQPATGLGLWIYLPRNDITLIVPARSTDIIPFLVRVPSNASPGDHVGGITATLESFITNSSGQHIRLLQSVGTRIFVRISGPLHPKLAVQDLTVRYSDPIDPLSDGRAVLTYKVSNVGNVALGGLPTASVSGLLGSRSSASHLPEIQLLLPGFSVHETAVVTGVYPELRESAHVKVTRLIIPGSVQPASGPFGAKESFWAIPWVLLGIVLAILVVLAYLIWRRRRRKRRPPSPGTPTGKSASEAPNESPDVPAKSEPVEVPAAADRAESN